MKQLQLSTMDLSINHVRPDFYHAGPPTLIYVKAPNNVEYRVRLVDLHGIMSNEVSRYPDRFNVRVPMPLPKAPFDDEKVIMSGELVRLPRKNAPSGDANLRGSSSMELTGGRGGDSVVTRINLGKSDISLSENGKIDIEVNGESIVTADDLLVTTSKDLTQHSFCGGMKRVILKENMVANLIPTTLVTPLPTYMPDFSFLTNMKDVTVNVISLIDTLG